ncbi:hypothetical protein PRK78_000528 [Emydomyces testavorans]|uniref:NACHT domain-containing protein n=1 Tax=Emydomyces testavorans TaxID=2070801 RepID=A0AAF0DBN1_9EURO|nr:hypothetical protein PRK78_000528 [Emydomyces testavorans]
MQSYGFGDSGSDKRIGTAYVVGRHKKAYARIISQVHGMLFFATPHKGSLYASTLSNVLGIAGIPPKAYVSELDVLSTSLQDLHFQFHAACDSLRIVSLYETLPTKAGPGKKRIGRIQVSLAVKMKYGLHSVQTITRTSDQNFNIVISYLRRLLDGLDKTIGMEKALVKALGIKQDLEDDFGQYLNQGTPGSCQWFHRRDSFNQWLESSANTPNNNILWLTGLPGAGKSTLSAMTVDLLYQKGLKQSCQYYFFIGSQPTKRSMAYCLRSIAFQLAQFNPEFADKLLRLYHDTSLTIETQRFQAVWNTLFEGLIFKMDFGCTLHWVIDAIDEAENPKDFITLLMRMRPTNCIKILLFSRPAADLTGLTFQRTDDLCLESISILDTTEDIRTYLNATVPFAFPNKRKTQEDVVEQILSKAEGSFLWAKLALNTLQRTWHLEDNIQAALDDVPKDMESMYGKMLQQIQDDDIPKSKEMAMEILTWAACSFRPLKIIELEIGLERRLGRAVTFNNSTVELCRHFVRVDKDTVSLIHATARKFLVDSFKGRTPIIDSCGGHEGLAMVCLDCLCDDELRSTLQNIHGETASRTPDQLNRILKTHPFLAYAKDNWAYHVSHSNVRSPRLSVFLKRFFNKSILVWVHAVAVFGELQTLTRTARYLKAYARKLRKSSSVSSTSSIIPDDADVDVSFIELWILDLIRLVGKFGSNLMQNPSVIHQHIPPLCPKDSIIAQTYDKPNISAVAVKGVPFGGWDDNLAHLSVGQDETASRVRCAGVYFLTLVSSKGAVIVWYAETFEKLRHLEHHEWVTLMEVNKARTMVVTAGRFTFIVWDISTGKKCFSLKRDRQARAMCVSFAENDTGLLVGYDDCTVVRYDLCGSKAVAVYDVEDRSERRHSCPRLMEINPDLSKVAVAYRGRPVLVWDLVEGSAQEPKRCIRNKDRENWHNKPQEVWNAPEIVRWQPNGQSLFILYQDNTVVHWHLFEDFQLEYDNTEAREMATSDDGTLLLTSSNTGTLSVWTVTNFHLVYRLSCGPFVRDITFSPDNQRIYDVRGSICNVWEPDALVRLEEGDHEESSSLSDGLFITEPTYSQGFQGAAQTTSVTCDHSDEYYICGRDDGSIWLHEMTQGNKIKKLWSHSVMSDVILLEWSPSRRYLASADDAGKVILKALGLRDGRWVVYNVFQFRVQEFVRQFLFSPDGSLLLVSTATMDFVWNVKERSEVCRSKWFLETGRRWFNHPSDKGKLVWIDPNEFHIHNWLDLSGVGKQQTQRIDTCPSPDDGGSNGTDVPIPSFSFTWSVEAQEAVQTIAKSIDGRYLICEVAIDASQAGCGPNQNLRLEAIRISDLESTTGNTSKRKSLDGLANVVQRFLGCIYGCIVFLDNENWICTLELDAVSAKPLRHFFIPRDWLNISNIHMLTMAPNGKFLCPKAGEIAVITHRKMLQA